MKSQETQDMEKVAESLKEYFMPRFIKECSDRGITFANEEELNAGLESAILVTNTAQAMEQKQAAETINYKVKANELLKKAMFNQ